MKLHIAKEYLSPVWKKNFDLIINRGKGSYVYDDEGNKYLDFTTGIGVLNTGHGHPRIIKRLKKELDNGIFHAQQNIFYHKPMLELADKMKYIVPQDYPSFFFSNSGSEAVEATLKLVRQTTGKNNIISMTGALHGRTYGAMSISSNNVEFKKKYNLLSGSHYIDYPSSNNRSIEQLDVLFKRHCHPDDIAALIIEPILGEGGYILPNKYTFEEIYNICKKNNILFIADEIQTGIGRTGKWFATENSNVKPDITLFGKGIASGLPLAGLSAEKNIMEQWIKGTHGGTYSGNILACAAACETIDIINEEKLLDNSKLRGKQILNNFDWKIFEDIKEIRGEGLMIAIEFEREKGYASKLCKRCKKLGLLLISAGVNETIRVIPPLNVTYEELNEFYRIFKESKLSLDNFLKEDNHFVI